MAEGAEALNMGKLNRFIETPLVKIKNLATNLYGSNRATRQRHAQTLVHLTVCNQYATDKTQRRTNTRQSEYKDAPTQIKT
jgi:hypothetical protein